MIDRVESFGQVNEYGCTVAMAVMMSFRTLSVAEVHPCMTSSETRLHSEEGMVEFEMVSNLFVDLAFEDLRKTG